MNRRHLLLATAALAACDGPQPRDRSTAARSGGARVRWRLASSFPRSLDTLFGGAERIARRVAELTDGAFEIRVYPAGELVPALQVLDAVQGGTVECGHTASYYYLGKNPAFAFDACVPFDLTARQKLAWLVEGGGLDLLNRRFADFGILSLPSGNTGVQMGGWFRRPVHALSDLGGLKMRIPGMGGSVMAALGVAVQNIAGGDIFPALERGAIDATEWVGPHDDLALGFHRAVQTYHYPGWWEPGPNLSLYVNLTQWAALPASYQQALRAAALETAPWMLARYDALNPLALERLLAEGVQLRPFPQDVLDAAWEVSQQQLADQAAADPEYREVYDHWADFRRRQFQWLGFAEQAYTNFVADRGRRPVGG